MSTTFDPDNLKGSLMASEIVRRDLPKVAKIAEIARVFDEQNMDGVYTAEYLALCRARLDGELNQEKRFALEVRIATIEHLEANYPDHCAAFRASSEQFHARAARALALLLNRCIDVVYGWEETLPSPELTAFLAGLFAMQGDQTAAIKFFGLGDFYHRPLLQEIEL